MQVIDTPEHEPAKPEELGEGLSARFSSWRGFFFASIAVNLLFVYGMLAGMSDAAVSIWYKTLIWLPFNVIASVLYLAIMARLGNAGWGVFRVLGAAMIVANWSVLLSV